MWHISWVRSTTIDGQTSNATYSSAVAHRYTALLTSPDRLSRMSCILWATTVDHSCTGACDLEIVHMLCNLEIAQILRLHGTHTHTQHMYTHMLTATHTLLETCNHWPNRHAGCPSCIFYNLVHQSFGSPEKKEESKECFSHRTNIVAPLPEVHSKSVFGSFILKQNGKGLGDFIMWVTSPFTSGRRRQERRGESLKVYETHICSAHPKTKSWSSCNTQVTEDMDT